MKSSEYEWKLYDNAILSVQGTERESLYWYHFTRLGTILWFVKIKNKEQELNFCYVPSFTPFSSESLKFRFSNCNARGAMTSYPKIKWFTARCILSVAMWTPSRGWSIYGCTIERERTEFSPIFSLESLDWSVREMKEVVDCGMEKDLLRNNFPLEW